MLRRLLRKDILFHIPQAFQFDQEAEKGHIHEHADVADVGAV